MTAWTIAPLAQVLTQEKQYVTELEPRSYPKLSVKLYGRGAVLDTPADAITLKMERHQLAKAGQVILSEIWGKKGAIGIVPPEGQGALVTSHFFLFNIDVQQVDPGWIGWLLRSNYLEPQLSSEARGTTGYAAVRPPHLLAATVPLPPLSEQHRIIARIEKLAAKIEEALVARRRATLQTSSLVSTMAARSFAALQANGRLGDVLRSMPRNGWSMRCDNLDGGTPVLALSAVTGFRFRDREFKRTSAVTNPDAHYWLRDGELLITRSNTPDLVGHAAIYDGSPSPCIYPDLMMRLDVDPTRADTRFVHRWLASPVARAFVTASAKGTSPSMRKISQGVVAAIPFPTNTPLQEQRLIVAELDAFQRISDVLRQHQIETSTELNALLPSVLDRAFSGNL